MMNREEMREKEKSFLEEMRKDERAESTLRRYRCDISMFLDSVGHEGDVTKDDVIAFKNGMLDRYRASTTSTKITALNKFIHYCETGEISRQIPKPADTLEVKQIRVQTAPSLDKVLEPGELKRLLQYARKLGYEDMYLIMRIFAYTGIRESELRYFTVESVKKNVIQIRNKGKIREIILRGDLKRELSSYIAGKGLSSGYIFASPRDPGKVIPPETVWWRMKKIAGAARIELDKVHAHSFRHLFCMQFIEQGGSVEELADICGHSSTETTRIYLRSTVKQKKRRLEELTY